MSNKSKAIEKIALGAVALGAVALAAVCACFGFIIAPTANADADRYAIDPNAPQTLSNGEEPGLLSRERADAAQAQDRAEKAQELIAAIGQASEEAGEVYELESRGYFYHDQAAIDAGGITEWEKDYYASHNLTDRPRIREVLP